MKFIAKLGLVLLAATSVFAASPTQTRTAYDLTLKNGFTIHHLRHEIVGTNTRLYLDDTNFIDVPTADIDTIVESREPAPVAPELQKKPVDLTRWSPQPATNTRSIPI